MATLKLKKKETPKAAAPAVKLVKSAAKAVPAQKAEVKLVPMSKKDTIAASQQPEQDGFIGHQNIPTFDEKLGVLAILKPCATTGHFAELFAAKAYDNGEMAKRLNARKRQRVFGIITNLRSAKMGLNSEGKVALLVDADFARAAK